MSVQFLKPKYITKKINGVDIKFYAIPARMLFKLQDVATPVLNSMIALFKDRSDDSGRVMQDFTAGAEAGSKTEIMPVTLEIARYRDQHTHETLAKLISALTHPEAKLILGELLMSSMREEFKPKPSGFSDADILALVDAPDFDVDTLTALLGGVLEASKGMLGPLGHLAETVLKTVKARIGDVVQSASQTE